MPVAAFSREGQTADNRFAADVLTELAQYDALFKLPVSNKNDLAGVIADIDPTIREVGDATREDERQESGADQRTLFRSLSGRDLYVYERGREVWIDVSRFDAGQGGDAVYQAVANYAHNAKKVFVGDPAGLSAEAVERRTYHMLGAALRFGTTAHFQPAPEQLKGVAEKGIAPLKWQGNDGEKLASLVQSFTETLFNRNPKLRDYRYDFDARQFVGPDGKPVARDSLLLGMHPRARSEAGGTRRTPAAGVFLHALAHQPSSKKPGLLALSGRRAPQLVDSLDGPLFSRTADSAGAQSVAAAKIDPKAALNEALTRTGGALANRLDLALNLLTRRQIVDVYDKDIPELKNYSTLVQRMDADKNEVGAQADQLADRWGKLRDEKPLAELMHDATLARTDPDLPFVERAEEKPLERRARLVEHKVLVDRFTALSDDAKAVYRETRDAYRVQYDNIKQAIRENIERAIKDEPTKLKFLDRLDTEFFKDIQGVYFPLARFGEYLVNVRDADGGLISHHRAETLNEANHLRAQLVEQGKTLGWDVGKVLKSKEFNARRDLAGKGFIKEIMDTLKTSGVDGNVIDSVAQLYLQSLPDLSWAKHGIHRKGTAGFSQDARRAFASNMFFGARYLAKLRYNDKLLDSLATMQEQVDSGAYNDGYDSVAAQKVVDHMNKRHDSLMNPDTNPVSTALTSIGFIFHLGLSPASAMVNLSQTALVAYPIMGAKWGYAKASAALLSASKLVTVSKNDLSNALTGDEKAAYEQAVRDGTIDVTQAHDLAGIAQGEDSKVAWKIRPVMKWASFLFHHAERFNRQVTFVAAYRLAREAGTAHEQAVEEATKATIDGHFDYSASNRAKAMQGNVARVVLLFKQYAQNMIYTLSRQAFLAMKGQTPEERIEARKALGGLLAMHAAAAGGLGLPIVSTLLAAASFLGGDDDEPWNAEVALKNTLADTFGPKAAEVMAHGLSRLTPWDISGRVGLDKLLFPDIQEGLDGGRWFESAATAALGPVVGIGLNALKGLQDVSEGRTVRGLEGMMPTALRGPLKAYRYATEGNVDRTGVVINDEVSLSGIAGQAAGFSPSETRAAQEVRSAIYSHDNALVERRKSLMNQYAMAKMAGDEEGAQEVREMINGFNEKNPARRIKPVQLVQSVRRRQQRIEGAEEGVYLPKNRRDAISAVRFGEVAEPQ